VFVHVDLDSFFVAVERARRPALIGCPVVIGGRPGSRGMVAAASREARRCGVRAGMPLAQASLRCPDGVFLDGAFDAYFQASLNVDAILRRETPDIEWQSIDEAYLGLAAGPRPRAAVEIETTERLQCAIHALGFDAACGLARSKLVARIASQLGKPRGVVHVLEGYEARFLSPLKIEMLPGIDQVLVRRLRAAGIRRLGQIARLAEPQLSLLAGRAGTALARQAAGMDFSRIRRTALPPARIEEHALEAPSNSAVVLAAALRREAERLGRDLRSRGVFARRLTLRIGFADGRVASRSAPLTEPTALDDALLMAATELLPRLWNEERLVRAVSVSCAGLMSSERDSALFPL
jgi:DNA polymerase-4